jgi:hypothetical protein
VGEFRVASAGLESITWTNYTPTVTLVGGAGNTVPQYATNTGRYAKAGNIVFVDILLEGDGGDEGAGTGVINIALPQTSSASIVEYSCSLEGYISDGGTVYHPFGTISASSDTIAMQKFWDAGGLVDFQGVDQDNATRVVRLHFWYAVD